MAEGAAERDAIAVGYLWRGSNPVSAAERFFAAYRRHPAGRAHRLIVLAKGFANDPAATIAAIAGDIDHCILPLPDDGFDLTAYRRMAERITCPRLCFFNSFSEILADGWLDHLATALEKAPDAGITGASGSYEQIDPAAGFPSWPNIHLRSNAFLIGRDDFLGLRWWPMRAKMDSNLFEAGPGGLTAQIMAKGRIPYIVDRHGRWFAPADWPESQTFRLGDQQGLLVADGRTRAYQEGDEAMRAYLHHLAWRAGPPGRSPLKRCKWYHRLWFWR